MRRPFPYVSVLLCVLAGSGRAAAQPIETVGARALGMGGAFVAVADDSSATWWNPAALAPGPFLDLSASIARTNSRADGAPVARARVTAVSLVTPPLGVSYYRFCITDIQPAGPTVTPSAGREDGRVGVVRSLRVHDVGLTLLTSVYTGVHIGTTLKFLRGRVEHTTGAGQSTPETLLDLGDELEGGRSQGQFDADVGVLAVAGPWRVGGIVRNLRRAGFGAPKGAHGWCRPTSTSCVTRRAPATDA
jgi:hypothetical protein